MPCSELLSFEMRMSKKNNLIGNVKGIKTQENIYLLKQYRNILISHKSSSTLNLRSHYRIVFRVE